MSCLIIEDDPGFAQILQGAMQAQFTKVDVAADGLQALMLAKSSNPTMIILDLTLPKIDGMSVLRRLRGEGLVCPILIVSGRDAIADRVEGLTAGADDYICKPMRVEELRARVRALLRRPGRNLLSVKLRVGDLEMDTSKHLVTRNGRVINLCKKEFTILEYLMRHTGFPVSRESMIDHCWDSNFTGRPTIIEVYINFLRRKIDHGEGKNLIHTLRGAGYTLAVME